MFTVANLLEQLGTEESLEQKKLEKILKLTRKPERQNLEIAINALSKLGVIDKQSDGFLKLIDSKAHIQARLRCSSKGYCFAIRDDGGEDIYIRDQYLNHAWNGDRVLVKVTREGYRRRSPEGVVICIIERTTQNLIALVEKDEDFKINTESDNQLEFALKLLNG